MRVRSYGLTIRIPDTWNMEKQIMNKRSLIREFLSERRLALVGISRSGRKFGNSIFKDLNGKGYSIYPVHPEASTIQGKACYPGIADLPDKVGGVILVIPPAETEKVVRDVVKAGIPRVWMQQGSESEEAVRYCEANGVQVISGECVMMFAEPAAFPHRLHRWIRGLFGKLPH